MPDMVVRQPPRSLALPERCRRQSVAFPPHVSIDRSIYMTTTKNTRWDALDVLRGLTIMLMLLNLSPGSWEFNYPFLVHARWEGWTLIDMVAPAFLFCIGVAMPLSLERRSARGAGRDALLRHVLWRGLLLVAIGLFLNLYPHFEFATFRIPGVLQRIGLCYALSGVFMLVTARSTESGIVFRAVPILWAGLVILASYLLLLWLVPTPMCAAPCFDPEGSWPAVIDRAVIGVDHFFPWWPVDGKVVFDPEGILSTWPACFNVLFGALVGIAWLRGGLRRPALVAFLVGSGMVVLALVMHAGHQPIIKNIWTPTFALFSSGFTLALLGALIPVTQMPGVTRLFWPARIFGENPLLAYILVFLFAPLVDANWFGDPAAPTSLRNTGQAWFDGFATPNAASLLFGLCGLLVLLGILLVCHRKRWILKL
jgi:predicted acyltransferase